MDDQLLINGLSVAFTGEDGAAVICTIRSTPKLASVSRQLRVLAGRYRKDEASLGGIYSCETWEG